MGDDWTPPGTDDALLRTAVHEACHVAVAHALGRGVRLVSILPGQHFGGIAINHPVAPHPDADLDALGAPVPLLPYRLRRRVERRIMIALAGPIGSSMVPGPPGYVPSAPRVPVRITSSQRALLKESDVPGESDEERAAGLATALCGPTAPEYLRWCHAEAMALISTRAIRQHLDRIVPVLLERGVLGSKELKPLLD